MADYTVSFANYTIGSDAFSEIPQICEKEGNRVLVIGGRKALQAAGSFLYAALEKSALKVAGEEWYGGECTYSHMDRLAEIGQKVQADMVFGVGGGKAIDTAKGVALKMGVPVYTIPTIAATCAAITALSVVYDDQGVFDSFLFLDRPPHHCFLGSQILAQAPECYLRAGMGDALAKHFECVMASTGLQLNHSSGLGREISRMCVGPVLEYGLSALEDVRCGKVSEALEQIILANVVSTGLVSLLVDESYNGAVAHSLFYGFTILPGFEEHNIHGDVVGYSVLVQLALEQKQEQLKEIYTFVKACGMPVCLKDMGVATERQLLQPVLEETLRGPDMKVLPYPVTDDMLFEAMQSLEEYGA